MRQTLYLGTMLATLLTGESCAGRIAHAASAPSDQFVGKYDCVTDDTSEISDGNRTPGHTYFDLDGDSTDAPVTFAVNVTQDDRVNVQDTFAGQPSGSFSGFRIVARVTTSDRPAIVAFRQEELSDRPIVIQMMFDSTQAHYGLAIISFSTSVPELRMGEAFVIVDLKMAHCKKL